MSFLDVQNPGIGGLDEITDSEALFLQNLTALSYAQGDILYYDGSNLNRLAAGTNGYVLKTQGAGANPIWASAGAGDVSKFGTPVNKQVGVWSGDGTLEGDAALTFDTTTDVLSSGGLLLSGLTASEIVITDASKNLVSAAVATYPSLTELTYVKGVTSAIQTQLGTKAPTASPTFTGTVTIPTPFTIGVVSMTATGTELNYVAGVTSAIQTQLGLKAPLASPTFTGTVTIPTPFTIGAVSMTATGTQLNFWNTLTGVSGSGTTGLLSTMTSVADGDVLSYSSGNWVNSYVGIATRADDDGTVALVTGDKDTLVTAGHATANAVSIAQAGSAGFPLSWTVNFCTAGAGVSTITPTTSTIWDGSTDAATLTLAKGDCATIFVSSTAGNGKYFSIIKRAIPTRTTGTTNFLREDNTYAAPAGGGLGYTLAIGTTTTISLNDGATIYVGTIGNLAAPTTTY